MSNEEITIKVSGDTEEAQAALDQFASDFESLFDELIQGSIKDLSAALGELPGQALERAGETFRTTVTGVASDAERASSRTNRAMQTLINPPIPQSAKPGNAPQQADHSADTPPENDETDTAKFRDQLNQQLTDQKLYGEQAKAFEAAFWQDKLDQADKGSASYGSILKQLYSVDNELATKAKQENLRIAEERISEQSNLALEQVESDQKIADMQVKHYEITQQQRLQLDQQYEDRRYAIEENALQQRLALDDLDAAKKVQAQDQLELLAKKHADKQVEITKEMAEEQAGIFAGLGNTLGSTLGRAFTQIAQGSTSFVNVLKGVWNTLASTFIQTTAKMVVAHALGENAKTLASTTGEEERLALRLWSSIQSLAISAAEGIKQVAISAYTAMAGAYAAIAAIPYVGPFLAPAAAAAAGAAVFEIGSSIASAEGGYDIPAGINPVTQLHAREMVLPAAQADVIRSLARNGAANGGTRSFHYHAAPGESRDSILRNEQDAVKMLKRAARSFAV